MNNGKIRVVIENIQPQVDGGRFAVKRSVGEEVVVSADVFVDGHDSVHCQLLHKPEEGAKWRRIPMEPLGNDRWEARFVPQSVGRHLYTVRAWAISAYAWKRELSQHVPGHALAFQHEPPLVLDVERERARYSTWYEFFPRSPWKLPAQAGASRSPVAEDIDTQDHPLREDDETSPHGTFRNCEARLPYIAQMGFDVLYLPPIHPIGESFRKGANNALVPEPDAPGSPWAIGSKAGGHKDIHPALGTLEDFRRLVSKAKELGIEMALDLAFQCSPDHPYVRDHPQWFLHRPDGTIQYAENPPKKYQDIFPLDFESDAWRELWSELKSIADHWIAQGVRIFRVDNPHTKPFAMWEWLIGAVRREHPDVIFLSEAFTRPKVMYRLAKLGFSQSYTYFTWRNTQHELVDYFTELARPPVADFFRPNLWPNTPDILNEFLQFGGRPAFMLRVVLAATLAANYGIYGPAFELMEREPREPGSEEYRDSEKYQLRHWDLERPDSLRDFIARINRIRRDNAALQSDRGLRFHAVDNESLLVYSKRRPDIADTVLVVVNLDPHHAQSGWLSLDLAALGIPANVAFQAHDLLSDARFMWQGAHNYVSLDPAQAPAHIFRIHRKLRTERDFDYFL